MNETLSYRFQRVPLGEINRQETLTDFSLSPNPPMLASSIKEIGVVHPVTLVRTGDGFRVVRGHRRIRVSQSLGLPDIPAHVLDAEPDRESMLDLNLTENQAHRQYSDVEKGLILNKLARSGVPEDRIIQKYMQRMGLESSKKLCVDLLQVDGLGPGLRQLLHDLKVPLRIFSILFRWETASRDAAEEMFSLLRPGLNKWRDLLELTDETARRENRAPAELLGREEIQAILKQPDLSPHEKYDQVFRTIYPWRFPILADLKKSVARALDRLGLDHKTKLRIQESFEESEIKIELRFRNRKELIEQADKLSRAAGSEAMADLIRLFQTPEK